MKHLFFNIVFFIVLIVFSACQQQNQIENTLYTATQQIGYQVKLIEESGGFLNPRSFRDGEIIYIPIDDWTSGFFPGTLWYMYELTNDEKWKKVAIRYTEEIDSAKFVTSHHDVGFIVGCSFGNAYRITNNKLYEGVIVQAAKSLSSRYRKIPGVIQSWDIDKDWQSQRGWMCPVIIDNMMNLELLFEATKLTGDSSYYQIAINHANNTLNNHYRLDFSSYHVIDYDTINGEIRNRHTAQGYAHESAWARGQAWGLYGFTICYRETKDKRYLDIADKIYNFIFHHPNLPNDLIPYWDLNAPNIPNEPRDASAAAITASALYELSEYERPKYKKTADKIMNSLCSPAYLAVIGTNGNFLLMHSVGSIPHRGEIDVPLNYADYYFLEALLRKKKLQ